MLKGISPLISPELLKILCEMGHGDEIVIADGNFPAESVGKNAKVVRMDGHNVPEVLKVVLELIPLDQYVDRPVSLMDRVPGDSADVSVWKEYENILLAAEGKGRESINMLERFEFYKQAERAYAVIATSERRQYANIILKKGCVLE